MEAPRIVEFPAQEGIDLLAGLVSSEALEGHSTGQSVAPMPEAEPEFVDHAVSSEYARAAYVRGRRIRKEQLLRLCIRGHLRAI